jgi:hypothetical protein
MIDERSEGRLISDLPAFAAERLMDLDVEAKGAATACGRPIA